MTLNPIVSAACEALEHEHPDAMLLYLSRQSLRRQFRNYANKRLSNKQMDDLQMRLAGKVAHLVYLTAKEGLDVLKVP